MGWGLALVTDRCPGIRSWEMAAVLELEVNSTKETDNFLNEFSPRKWLETAARACLEWF